MKNNYYIKVGAFYLNFYSLDKEAFSTDFISDIELDSDEINAMVFETFESAFAVSELLKKYLKSDSIYVVEEIEKA